MVLNRLFAFRKRAEVAPTQYWVRVRDTRRNLGDEYIPELAERVPLKLSGTLALIVPPGGCSWYARSMALPSLIAACAEILDGKVVGE